MQLQVDLRRNAEVQNLRNDVRRLEIKQQIREGLVERYSQAFHIIGGWCVSFFERDKDLPVVDADRRPVREGQVIDPGGQSDIVKNEPKILAGNFASDFIFDGLEDLLRALDPRSGRGADMQLNEAGVDLRKEVGSHIERHRDRAGNDAQCQQGNGNAPVEDACQDPGIDIAKVIETSIEALVETHQKTAMPGRVIRLLAAQQQPYDDWRQRARDHV